MPHGAGLPPPVRSGGHRCEGCSVEEVGRLLASEEVAPGAHRPASLGPVAVLPEQGADGVSVEQAAMRQSPVLGELPEPWGWEATSQKIQAFLGTGVRWHS